MASDSRPEPASTTEGSIKAIDSGAVHRLCSGQVILSLATAVKELVENAIDAGANKVEVKLTEHGSEVIQVSDNGRGVEPHNFQALTLKHHTSKLRDFDDLTYVQTFGFRGEALSSLCAMGHLTVSTRHSSQPVGTQLSFDHDGKIVSQESNPRPVGTTLTLRNIFVTMPVRLKEFQRNLKREFAKMVKVLQAYCIISTGVRISCSNSVKNKRTVLLSSSGGDALDKQIVDVFGSAQMATLKEIRTVRPSLELWQSFNLRGEVFVESLPFEVKGYVSTCVHGKGRSAPDRQFYFVNGRPCDPLKVSKLVNEVYHSFNRYQNPFVVMDIRSQTAESVDVNLTPDKRKILLENENVLLAVIKASLMEIFDSAATSFTVNNIPLSAAFAAKKNGDDAEENAEVVSESTVNDGTSNNSKVSFNALRTMFGSSGSNKTSSIESPPAAKKARTMTSRQEKISNFVSYETKRTSSVSSTLGQENVPEKLSSSTSENPGPVFQIYTKQSESISAGEKSDVKSNDHEMDTDEADENVIVVEDEMPARDKDDKSRCAELQFSMEKLRISIGENCGKKRLGDQDRFRRFLANINPEQNSTAEQELEKEIKKTDFERMRIYGQFNLGFIIAGLPAKAGSFQENENNAENFDAEEVEDLFIIDQHATDEKYNFERLQQTEKLQAQKLAVPQKLDLPPTSRSLLLSNMDTFTANGFQFDVTEEEEKADERTEMEADELAKEVDDRDKADERATIKLTTIPISRNWTFGKQDIEELLFMLGESDTNLHSTTLLRPSRIRTMLASRACRTSVMIGTALDAKAMQRLVRHMGELDQPWNCPHGRPTMRHLINLNMIRKR